MIAWKLVISADKILKGRRAVSKYKRWMAYVIRVCCRYAVNGMMKAMSGGAWSCGCDKI